MSKTSPIVEKSIADTAPFLTNLRFENRPRQPALVFFVFLIDNKIMKGKPSVQDTIFKKMSPDRKVEIGSLLWCFAKELVGRKIDYGPRRRSKTPAD